MGPSKQLKLIIQIERNIVRIPVQLTRGRQAWPKIWIWDSKPGPLNVPYCFRMFHVPDFIDGHVGHMLQRPARKLVKKKWILVHFYVVAGNNLQEQYTRGKAIQQRGTRKIPETELRKADRTVGVNCYILSNISSGTAWLLQGNVHNWKKTSQDKSLYSITILLEVRWVVSGRGLKGVFRRRWIMKICEESLYLCCCSLWRDFLMPVWSCVPRV